MCCIMVKPKGFVLKESTFNGWVEEMTTSNKDGNGVVWQDKDGKINWLKGIANDKLLDYNVRNLVITHTRHSTSGNLKSSEMCHPFLISPDRELTETSGVLNDNELLLMHNGVISNFSDCDDELSDTAIAARSLRPFLSEIIKCPTIAKDVLHGYSKSSRFILINSSGEVFVFGDWIYEEFSLKIDEEEKSVYVLFSNKNYK